MDDLADVDALGLHKVVKELFQAGGIERIGDSKFGFEFRQQAAPFEDRDDAVAIEGEVGDGTVRQEMLLALRRHAEDPTPM